MKGARSFAAWAAFAMLALGAREAGAQITGSIGGTIHDASGAVLPGATVTVRGPNLQKEAATAVTGASGTYRVPLIPPPPARSSGRPRRVATERPRSRDGAAPGGRRGGYGTR